METLPTIPENSQWQYPESVRESCNLPDPNLDSPSKYPCKLDWGVICDPEHPDLPFKNESNTGSIGFESPTTPTPSSALACYRSVKEWYLSQTKGIAEYNEEARRLFPKDSGSYFNEDSGNSKDRQ